METALAEKQDILTLTTNDVKQYIAPTATDKEIYMFLNICKAYGLNPFKKEVHFVKYGNNPGQIIVGYETYLKRAESTGKLNGWKSWIDGDKAKIIIYRKDWNHPFEFEIDIKEFDKQQALWKTMRSFMAKKVVTAIGMRLCFPEDLGGMPYIPEELGMSNGDTVDAQAEHIVVDKPQDKPDKSKLKDIQKLIKTISEGRNISPSEVVAELGFKKTIDIPQDRYDEVLKTLNNRVDSLKKKVPITKMLNDFIKDEFDAEEV